MTKQHKPLTAVLYVVCVIEALMLITIALNMFWTLFTYALSRKINHSHVIAFVRYPETLTYVIGVDTELDFAGMTIACTKYGEEVEAHHMLDMNDPDLNVDVSAIDLTTPGVYPVYIDYFIEDYLYAGTTLPIEVIDPQQYMPIVEEG